jgi:hypothetical protein
MQALETKVLLENEQQKASTLKLEVFGGQSGCVTVKCLHTRQGETVPAAKITNINRKGSIS